MPLFLTESNDENWYCAMDMIKAIQCLTLKLSGVWNRSEVHNYSVMVPVTG